MLKMKTLKCAGSSNEVVVVVVVVVCSAALLVRDNNTQWTMSLAFRRGSRANSLAKLSSSNKAKTYNNKPHAQLRMEMLVKWKRSERKINQKKKMTGKKTLPILKCLWSAIIKRVVWRVY